MNFVTPGVIAIAAALTVPPLVALYFLKLRRQEVPISSTFFWKRAVQDLQVNAPFQRLRRNLLMLLQLLVLLLAAVALGQPLLRQEQSDKKSLILLIDRSASMNVVEPDGRTRLERAKAAALMTVEQVGTEFDRGMVIAFSDSAKMMAPFTGNRTQLEQAINRIEPSDGLSNLKEAIGLAEAHSQTQIVEAEGIPATPVPTGPAALAVLFSDGRIEDAGQLTLQRMSLQIVRDIAVNNDNVAIVTLTASRHYERPELLTVFSTVQNFGPGEVALDVELFIAGEPRDIQSITLEPGIAPTDAEDYDATKALRDVAFDEVEFFDSGVIEVRLSRKDDLPTDNQAFAIIEPPRNVKVLLVTPGNFHFREALSEGPFQLTIMSPDDYENAPEAELSEGGRARHDVVVFDTHTTARLPTGSYFFFGSVPTVEGFGMGEKVQAFTPSPIFDWDEGHPILRYINPDNIDFASYRKLILPDNAESLISAYEGPLLSLVSHGGNRYLICAFGLFDENREMYNTNWPLRLSFPIFMLNAVQYLSGSLAVQIEAKTRPGDPLTIKATKVGSEVTVTRPDGTTETAIVGSSRTAHYGRTDLVGVYSASLTVGGSTSYAVNLFSPSESRIQPNADFTIGGEAVQSKSSTRMANVPLWPWFLLVALAFLFLEWAVYSKRIFV